MTRPTLLFGMCKISTCGRESSYTSASRSMTPRSLTFCGGAPPTPPSPSPRLSDVGVVVSIGDDGDDGDDGDKDPSENDPSHLVPIVASLATTTGPIDPSLPSPILGSRCRRPKIFTSPLLASGGGVNGNGGRTTGTPRPAISPIPLGVTTTPPPPSPPTAILSPPPPPPPSARAPGLGARARPRPDVPDRRPIAPFARDITRGNFYATLIPPRRPPVSRARPFTRAYSSRASPRSRCRARPRSRVLTRRRDDATARRARANDESYVFFTSFSRVRAIVRASTRARVPRGTSHVKLWM